jgi:hypothetical protein
LARLGDPAVHEIELELDKSERHGGDAYGLRWLQLAYARIRGPAAYPRLRRMEGDSKRGFKRNNLDDSIALSLSLTSYVSDSRPLVRSIRCTRAPEPRDALDQVILGWQRDHRAWLEGALSPSGKSALKKLLEQRSWSEMRTDIWHAGAAGGIAVGYRFNVPGPWSEPVETLDDESASETPVITVKGPQFEIDTTFTDRSGRPCGSKRIRFLEDKVGVERRSYYIDDTNVFDFFKLISACAVPDK